jgi:hypothetical protein
MHSIRVVWYPSFDREIYGIPFFAGISWLQVLDDDSVQLKQAGVEDRSALAVTQR